jgi:predicted RND superfamily exporter protein
MLQKLIMASVERRYFVALCLLAVTVLAALGVPKVRIDTGFDRLALGNSADRQAYQRVTREFGSDNRTVVYVRDAALWTPGKLAALERLHRALAALPMVERIDDLHTRRSLRSTDGAVAAGPLLAGVPADVEAAESARRNALADPLALRNLISADGNAVALTVTLRERADARADRAAYRAIEQALEPARGVFAEAFQVGPPRIHAELEGSLMRDLKVLLPASAALVVLAVLAIFRSLFAALVPLATAGLSLLWTLGMLGHAGIPLGILGAMLPSLVVAIGASGSLHLMDGYFKGLDASPEGGRAAALRFMGAHLGVPAILTVATTAIGFASNAFIGIAVIRDFAAAATFAILANGALTLLLVPMLLALVGPQRMRRAQGAGEAGPVAGIAMQALGAMRRRLVFYGIAMAAALIAAFTYQGARLHATNDPLAWFRADRDLVLDASRIQRDLAGVKVFHITLDSGIERAFQDPPNLQKLVDIQAFVARQGVFDRSLSLADELSLANRELNDGRPDAYRVPATRKLVAQSLLFFQRRDLEPYVSQDFRRASIVVRHDVRDSTTLNSHVEELRQVARHIAGPEMAVSVTGENLMVNAAAGRLLGGQAETISILVTAIFLAMSLMFTSFKGGLVALVPSVAPVALMLVVMALAGIPLNAGTAMVAAIAIGIATGGTIHLYLRYNALCRRTSNYDEAILETFRQEARPVVASSLALALGFGVLLLSDFTLVAQFGALAACTMLVSTLANLLVTPMVMSRIRLVGLHDILAMPVQREVLEHSPLFGGMTPYQVRKAILISELHEIAAGTRLIEQGTMGSSMYVVVSGELEVVRRDDASERRLALLRPGDVLGEIGFVRATHRTADVRALGPVSLLRFDRDKLAKDLRFFPGIAAKLNFNISCILGQRLADLVESSDAAQGARPAE